MKLAPTSIVTCILLVVFSLATPAHADIKSNARKIGACAVLFGAALGVSYVGYLPQKHINNLPPATNADSLPSQFKIFQNYIALTDTFTVHDDKYRYGEIKEEILHLTKTFHYDLANGERVAKASVKFFSLGSDVLIYDGAGNNIAEVKEQIFESFFKVYTTYDVFDANGQKIAESKKTEVFSTEIIIYDLAGRPIFRLYRPWAHLLSEEWQVQTYEYSGANSIDPRIPLMIAAYKTSTDKDRADEDSSSDE